MRNTLRAVMLAQAFCLALVSPAVLEPAPVVDPEVSHLVNASPARHEVRSERVPVEVIQQEPDLTAVRKCGLSQCLQGCGLEAWGTCPISRLTPRWFAKAAKQQSALSAPRRRCRVLAFATSCVRSVEGSLSRPYTGSRMRTQRAVQLRVAPDVPIATVRPRR